MVTKIFVGVASWDAGLGQDSVDAGCFCDLRPQDAGRLLGL